MTAVPYSVEVPSAGRWSAFGAVAVLCLIAAQVFAFLTSPPDVNMGQLEKIM